MSVTTARLPESPPVRRPIDVDEYYRMVPEGLIGPDERTELIEGEVVRMPPIGPSHADVVDELGRGSRWAPLEPEVRVRIQGPVRLDRFNEPQPDIAVLRAKPGGYRREHPSAADVLLLIEVADSSLMQDRRVKLPLYARFGIPEIWLVNLPDRRIEVYRQPAGNSYTEQLEFRDGMLRAGRLPELAIDVAAILG